MSRSRLLSSRLPPKQEAFAHAFIATEGNATAAYRQAYSADSMSQGTIEVEASRLANHPKVSLRIVELLEDAFAAESLTPEWVIRKLREEAQDDGPGSSHSARVRALENLAKFQGMLVDRQDVSVAHSIETPSLDALTDAEIDALLDSVAARRKTVEGEVVIEGDTRSLEGDESEDTGA